MRCYPLDRIASDVSARWVRDRLTSVETAGRTVHTEGGAELPYDALLLAVGASETSPYLHAYVSTDRVAEDGFDRIVCEIEAGLVEEVAFVLPYEWVWPLPLYELALMTAHRARRANRSPRITFVTPEARPLKAFGRAAGDELLGLLGDAGVRLHTGVVARVPATGVVTFVDGEVRAERIVTLPSITGPAVTGVPAGSRWFVPINERCVVPSTDGRVFAAGDATDFPVNGGHRRPAGGRGGGWYCPHRQRRRSPPAAAPCDPRSPVDRRPTPVRGGKGSRWPGWQSETYEHPPWPAHEKIVAEELGDYLRRHDLP